MNEDARRIVLDAVNRNLGTCSHCGRLKRLTSDGLITGHFLSIPVSRSAIRYVGAGRKRVKCQGSGKPPRRPLGEA